ncbi:MAG: FecR domain-containing protein [Spirochaetales bacterium]|nr:FecR domain-containing protein [Spirochaetales bacterium]
MTEDKDQQLKKILAAADVPVSVSKESEELIFTRLRELSAQKKQEPRLVDYFRLVPALRAAVAILVLIPCLFLAYSFIFGSFPERYPLSIVNGSGMIALTGEKAGTGYRMGKNDGLRADDNAFCDLSLADIVQLRLYPQSEMRLTGYSAWDPGINLRLEKGSLYVDKKGKLEWDKKVIIELDRYRFALAGTRAQFTIDEEAVTIACFEGNVLISSREKDEYIELFALNRDEKIRIRLDRPSLPETKQIAPVSDQDRQTDRDNRDQKPYSTPPQKEQTEAAPIVKETKTDIEKPQNELDKSERPTEQEEPAEKEIRDVRPVVTEIGLLDDPSVSAGKFNFFASCPGPNGTYLLTQGTCRKLSGDRLFSPLGFPSKPVFRIKPVLFDGKVILTENTRIFIFDSSNDSLIATVKLDPQDSLDDNYYPVRMDDRILFPVRNRGYFTINPNNPLPVLSPFITEVFPLTPVVYSDRVYVGAFYQNYIKALDSEGREIWKTEVPEGTLSNMALINGELYLPVVEDGVSRIIKIKKDGTRDGEWKLAGRIIADILAFERSIIGLYTDGTLFQLDLSDSRSMPIERIFRTQLTNKASRNYYPIILGRRLYTGTEDGYLLSYDLYDRKIVERILIRTGEPFYTAPFAAGTGVYLVSNTGTLYKVTQTGN